MSLETEQQSLEIVRELIRECKKMSEQLYEAHLKIADLQKRVALLESTGAL